MSVLGRDNFSRGITKRSRVALSMEAILARVSGYQIVEGYLVPENVTSRLSTSGALAGTTPEQVPFPFVDSSGTTRVIARDANEAMREFSGTTWGGAGSACTVLPEGISCRMKSQVIIPTDGPNPRLMVYEPESTTTKLRPLSLKGPADYGSARPVLSTAAGGYSGPALRPIALAAVLAAYRASGLPIVGVGGVENGRHALEFIVCGASAVALGTVLFTDPGAPERVRAELAAEAAALGLANPLDARGIALTGGLDSLPRLTKYVN